MSRGLPWALEKGAQFQFGRELPAVSARLLSRLFEPNDVGYAGLCIERERSDKLRLAAPFGLRRGGKLPDVKTECA